MSLTITNNHNLPAPIVRAVEGDPYPTGKARDFDVSVTQLLKPLLMVSLAKHSKAARTVDVIDRLWSMYGQLGHAVLERFAGKNELSEDRLYTTMNGRVVSGQFDSIMIQDGIMYDWKFTSVWAILAALQDEERTQDWHDQLNMLAYLAHVNGHEVKQLRIIAFARDWRPSESLRSDSYPERVEEFVIRLDSFDETKAAMGRRVKRYFEAQDTLPIDVTPCTPEERWRKPDTWALFKDKNKRATRTFDNEDDAQQALALAAENAPKAKFRIEYRQGEDVRCNGGIDKRAQYCEYAAECPHRVTA